MVDGYNNHAKESGYSPEQMIAVKGDFLGDDSFDNWSDDLRNFDVAVISMALHHVDNPGKMLKRLLERLKPGGVLMVIDRAARKEGGQEGAHNHGHHHHHHHQHEVDLNAHPTGKTIHPEHQAFAPEFLQKIFDSAGCSSATFRYVEHSEDFVVPESVSGVQGGLKGKLFLASAKKQA